MAQQGRVLAYSSGRGNSVGVLEPTRSLSSTCNSTARQLSQPLLSSVGSYTHEVSTHKLRDANLHLK